MLVDVERDQWRRVPDRIRVLRVAQVVEEAPLVPVVGRPGPAAARHSGGLQVGAPVLHGAEVALDQVADEAGGIASAATEMLEVDLVVLDPADREAEVDLERADVRKGLVRACGIHGVEPREDLVPLVDVALVELVMGLDAGTRDPVELIELGLELPGGDLLELERERRHLSLSSTTPARGAYPRPRHRLRCRVRAAGSARRPSEMTGRPNRAQIRKDP